MAQKERGLTLSQRLVAAGDNRIRIIALATALVAFAITGALQSARADAQSSEEILAGFNADGKLIVETFKKKVPEIYELCTTGAANVRRKVIAVPTYLASARKLNGEPWAAGDATTPYFEKYCEELAEAELEAELAN